MVSRPSNRKTEIDLEGRVRRLTFSPKNHVTRPLFEAIHNALDSISESACSEGMIKIQIIRDNSQQKLDIDDKSLAPIKELIISDNGRGFDEENMDSFATLDSQHKLEKGGKGVGHLSWLKAFERAEIESVFQDLEGFKLRTFVFSLKGFTKEKVLTSTLNETGSVIRLVNYKPLFESYFRGKKLVTLANEISRDFLPYLLFGKACKIELIDGVDCELITRQELPVDQKTEFEIGGQNFEVHHIRISSGEDSHQVIYCASGRSVFEERLHDIGISVGRRGKLKKEDNRDEFWYRAYVTSPYLDEHVNSDRTAFNIESEPLELTSLLQMVSMSEIKGKVKDAIHSYLEKPIDELAKQKEQRIKEAFEDDLAPYTYLLEENQDEIQKLPIDVAREEVVKKVTQMHAERQIAARHEASRVLDSLRKAGSKSEPFDDIHRNMNKWLKTYQADLAQYILYRAWVLELLSTLIGRLPNEDFFKEADLHELICPMQTEQWNQSTNEEGHNLWILDDRFSFYDYLASDVQLSKYQTRTPRKTKPEKDNDRAALPEAANKQRPDICTYYFSNNKDDEKTASIVIVEFKRPGRKNLKDKEGKSPLDQVLEYITKIREGKIRDRDGHEVHASDATSFYCYIICDTNVDQVKHIARAYRMEPTLEDGGYYVHYEKEKAYIEIMSFKKLLTVARKRHQKLFAKLRLPEKLKNRILNNISDENELDSPIAEHT